MGCSINVGVSVRIGKAFSSRFCYSNKKLQLLGPNNNKIFIFLLPCPWLWLILLTKATHMTKPDGNGSQEGEENICEQ